jgi:hypothetical protein
VHTLTLSLFFGRENNVNNKYVVIAFKPLAILKFLSLCLNLIIITTIDSTSYRQLSFSDILNKKLGTILMIFSSSCRVVGAAGHVLPEVLVKDVFSAAVPVKRTEKH